MTLLYMLLHAAAETASLWPAWAALARLRWSPMSIRLRADTKRLERTLARMARMWRSIEVGPIAPGEVRCGAEHGVPAMGGGMRPTTTSALGCPSCGAQL